MASATRGASWDHALQRSGRFPNNCSPPVVGRGRGGFPGEFFSSGVHRDYGWRFHREWRGCRTASPRCRGEISAAWRCIFSVCCVHVTSRWEPSIALGAAVLISQDRGMGENPAIGAVLVAETELRLVVLASLGDAAWTLAGWPPGRRDGRGFAIPRNRRRFRLPDNRSGFSTLGRNELVGGQVPFHSPTLAALTAACCRNRAMRCASSLRLRSVMSWKMVANWPWVGE